MQIARAVRLLALLVLTSCASVGPAVRTYLDTKTAVTVRASAEPWVFAREAPELAANSRDYLDLRLLEVDSMGERRLYLTATAWSTVDRRGAPTAAATVLAQLRLLAGGETCDLVDPPAGDDAAAVTTRMFERRPGQLAVHAYAIAPDVARRFVGAGALRVELGTGHALRYESWRLPATPITTLLGEPRAGGKSRL
jgi:hypothetical protein